MRINVYTDDLPSVFPLAEVVTADYVSSRTGECGAKQTNIGKLLSMFSQVYEADNLTRFRKTVGQVEEKPSGNFVGK